MNPRDILNTMPIRANWGIVAVACGFAVLAIGVAVGTAYFEKSPAKTGSIVADANAPTYSDTDWRKTLATIATSTIDANGNYHAPAGLSPTDAASTALLTQYLKISKDGTPTPEQTQAAISDVIAQNVKPITPDRVYTLGNVHTSAIPVGTYAGALAMTLNKSRAIKEYELATFSRTTGLDNYNGTPQLIADSNIYAEIEHDLATMQVPQAVAAEHLALLQSISLLAQSTKLLGSWSGDPITALADMDAFVKADHSSQIALTNLFNKLNKLSKQT